MTTTSMMFGEIEITANRALARAILMSEAAHAYLHAINASRELAKALESLVAVLSPQTLTRLTADQKKWLAGRVQEIHKYVAALSRSNEAAVVLKVPILSKWVRKIQDATEDLGDIIEDLVLIDDADFRNLIAACERSIIAAEGDPIGTMHG